MISAVLYNLSHCVCKMDVNARRMCLQTLRGKIAITILIILVYSAGEAGQRSAATETTTAAATTAEHVGAAIILDLVRGSFGERVSI